MQHSKIIPMIGWLAGYRRADLPGDAIAGTITAIMLVPQSMAYALLAGLPPHVGLYASIAPLVFYALFGSSRVLAVGPVALISLLVANTVGVVEQQGIAAHQAALMLALLVGAFNVILGVMRAGFLVNFLSHPVISGFTSAAALVIGFSQLKHLLGIDIPRTNDILETASHAIRQSGQINTAAFMIGVGGIIFLMIARGPLSAALQRLGLKKMVSDIIAKAAPLILVLVSTLTVWMMGLDQTASVATVGVIPAGLPPLTLPVADLAVWRSLFPSALLISLVGFLESVSIAKALASKRRQKIDANQELLGLGAANIGAALTGGYPVTGGFSRSSVNFEAGANTPLASIITAGLVALTLLFLTSYFHFLPQAALAAIIVVAVSGLIDLHILKTAWAYNKADAASLIVTFFAVLMFNVEIGIVTGLIASLVLFLWRTATPHYAIVGRVAGTEHFRNIRRHKVEINPEILAIRIDESLYFANARFLETTLLNKVAENTALRHIILICSAVNVVDTSALESLETLIDELRDAHVTLHLAEVKGPVMDKFRRTDLLERLKPGHVFLSTHDAVLTLERHLQGEKN